MFVFRAFYQTLIRSFIGVDFDAFGVTFYPYDGEENKIENLSVLGKKFNITNKGNGRYIKEILLNGKAIKGTNRIPYDMLSNENDITVCKCEEKPCIAIHSFNGVSITEYNFKEGVISFNAQITGHNLLKIETDCDVDVSMNGNKKKYCSENGIVKLTITNDNTEDLLNIVISKAEK